MRLYEFSEEETDIVLPGNDMRGTFFDQILAEPYRKKIHLEQPDYDQAKEVYNIYKEVDKAFQFLIASNELWKHAYELDAENTKKMFMKVIKS